MFLTSILSVLISSYLLLSSVIKKDKNAAGFIYYLLIAFSQIILSFEILSLFKSISKNGIFICNMFFLISAVLIFIKSGKIFYVPNIYKELKKIIFSIKRDKLLGFLSVCFILFLIFQLVSALCFPVTFGDALTYYLPRCTAWIQNGSINHFITPDTRELIMPVNMEFLYTWLLLFTKSEQGCAVFSYIGFIGGIYTIYNFLKELNFTVRRRLWSIFIFSSFALVAIEMYTPCADLFIGSLILSGIFLFYKSSKNNDKNAFFFSALSFALSAGVKTTAIIAMPSVFIVLLIITYFYKKEIFAKYILKFCGIFILCFLIFSSYNYILNIIQFSHPISCSEQLLLNKFRGGFKGWLSNLIKYSFAIFDISGIKDFINYNGFITYIQSLTLGLFGITDKNFTSPYFNRYFYFNSEMSMMNSALGITGLFAFLPSIIKSIKKYIKNKINKRNIIMASLTLSLIINLLIFSRVMVFTGFNMRYILTFAVIASPVCAFSYIKSNKKFLKYLLCFFMFVYFIIIAHKMPVSYLVSYIKFHYKNPASSSTNFLLAKSEEIDVYNYLKNQDKKQIALIIPQVRTPNYYIEKLRLEGFHIDKLLLENIEEYNISKYDYIVTKPYKSSSNYIVKFEERINLPELFVSRCLYCDYRQASIYDTNTKPAMVECEIPFNYFMQNGFIFDDNINLKDYIILKNQVKLFQSSTGVFSYAKTMVSD